MRIARSQKLGLLVDCLEERFAAIRALECHPILVPYAPLELTNTCVGLVAVDEHKSQRPRHALDPLRRCFRVIGAVSMRDPQVLRQL